MRRHCIFCRADGPLTREHVFPRWMTEVFPGTALFEYRVQERDGPEAPLRVYRRAGLAETAKMVCGQCNNGWLSALEERAKPLLVELINGSERILTPADSELLSTWAVKTAIVSAHTTEAIRGLSEEQVWDFHSRRGPNPHSVVWLGSYIGPPDHALKVFPRFVQMSGATSKQEWPALDWTAAMGRLLLKALLLPPALWGRTMSVAANPDAPLTEIFPVPVTDVDYPPGLPFNEESLRWLSWAAVNAPDPNHPRPQGSSSESDAAD